ncbi:MAG: cysteine desulfurase [Eggerthellaceae bacterium]|nr:cysteine desulfurase [Eggerthellaceae bacterium]
MLHDHIYFDYAATAPLCEASREVLQQFYAESPDALTLNANANSLHSDGRTAFAKLEEARATIAQSLSVRPPEIVFTSGATESDNLALCGVIRAARRKNPQLVPHIITTQIEHDAVYLMANKLESSGEARVTYVAPHKDGSIDAKDIEAALEEATVLVSVIAADNETGVIQDLAAIGKTAHAAHVLFHADCSQAYGKVPLDFSSLDIDLASFSAHKIGGPKGVGALYIKSQTPIEAQIIGGGQEGGMRSGTQNVAGACAFAAAVQSLCLEESLIEENAAHMMNLRDGLYAGFLSHKGVHASVDCPTGSKKYLPNIVNVCVEGVESETLILQFDLAGIAVSGGSACSSHSLDASRTLCALGIPYDLALGSLRISLGYQSSEDEVRRCLAVFSSILDSFQRS